MQARERSRGECTSQLGFETRVAGYTAEMRSWIALALVGLVAPAAANDDDPPQTPFDRGKVGIGIYGGKQTTLGYRYFALGGSVGYFVLDGLEVEFGALHQFGGGPSISKLTPSVRYIAQPLVGRLPVIPYVGLFYNHWFIGSDVADIDTLGVHGGLLYVSGRAILGAGVVYERIVSACVTECSAVYPEFTVGLAL